MTEYLTLWNVLGALAYIFVYAFSAKVCETRSERKCPRWSKTKGRCTDRKNHFHEAPWIALILWPLTAWVWLAITLADKSRLGLKDKVSKEERKALRDFRVAEIRAWEAQEAYKTARAVAGTEEALGISTQKDEDDYRLND